MKRYVCIECKSLHRASASDVIRCRRCTNKVGGTANRPNRRMVGKGRIKFTTKPSTPPKTERKGREKRV